MRLELKLLLDVEHVLEVVKELGLVSTRVQVANAAAQIVHGHLPRPLDVVLGGQVHVDAARYRRVETKVGAVDEVADVFGAELVDAGVSGLDAEYVFVAGLERFHLGLRVLLEALLHLLLELLQLLLALLLLELGLLRLNVFEFGLGLLALTLILVVSLHGLIKTAS